MTITIRTGTPADAATVTDFNARLAFESENKQLDADQLRAGVTAILADPETRGHYFLAQEGDRIVGQLAITLEWSDWRNGWFWWFQSVYVVKDARNRGVFAQLYDHVLQLARARDDICGLRLYVDDHNSNAQKVYLTRGLTRAGYHIMELDLRASQE